MEKEERFIMQKGKCVGLTYRELSCAIGISCLLVVVPRHITSYSYPRLTTFGIRVNQKPSDLGAEVHVKYKNLDDFFAGRQVSNVSCLVLVDGHI